MKRQACAIMASLITCAGANALEFEAGPVTGRLDNSLSYGVGWRLDNPKDENIGIANGGSAESVNFDDGTQNFDNNSTPVYRSLKLNTELSLDWGVFSAFVRTRLLYDSRQDDEALGFDRQTKNEVAEAADLLDAYISAAFDVGNFPVFVRVGQQTIKWGESQFTLHGLSEINALNAARFRVPGAEINELTEPAPMVFGAINLTDSVSLEGFYQWRWERTEPDPRGTFYSTNDFAAIGGEFILLGFGQIDEPQDDIVGNEPVSEGATVRRASDRNPDDEGQYGFALRYIADWLGGTEFGFYGAQYHSRRPLYSGLAPTGSANTGRYFSEYPEDIQIFGISFNAVEPNTGLAIQGEYTHRRGEPLQVDDVELLLTALGLPGSQTGSFPGAGNYIQGFRRFNYSQYILSATKNIGPDNIFGADSMQALFELGASHIHGFPARDELRFNGPGTYCRGGNDQSIATAVPGYCTDNTGFPTASAWGFKLGVKWNYSNVFAGVNVTPRLAWFVDVNGTTPDPLVLYVEGRRQTILGFEFTKGAWAFDIYANTYAGGSRFNQLRDRDLIGLSLKYAF